MVADPHDPFAERAVVGAILAAGTVTDNIATVLRPDDLYDPQLRAVAEACWDLAAQTKPCDPVTIRTELLRRGQRGNAVEGPWLATLYSEGMPVSAGHHARIVRDLAVRRSVIAEARRAAQAAGNPGVDPYDIAASLHIQAGLLADRTDVGPSSSAMDLADFCAGNMDYDWLVPGLLERGDRLLLTGVEGGGKSYLTRQIAVATAAGVHPFTGARNEPRKVLLVDLENGERTLRRHLVLLRQHCDRIQRPVPLRGLMVESLPSGTDLTQTDGEAWLSRLCEDVQPDLLVIGPLYRMHATDMAKEEPARHLTRVLDAMRARHGCAVVVETHAPHDSGQGKQRSLRPVGSSLFMRWPEFGYGIRKDQDGSYGLVPWRGPRDERSWPKKLRRGGAGEWPWMEATDAVAALGRYWESVEQGGGA